jgi:hypothetical protein
MARFTGSAAVAAQVATMPQSAVRSCILKCVSALRHSCDLAEIAAHGSEPEVGAVFLTERIASLRSDLNVLRAVSRETRRSGAA